MPLLPVPAQNVVIWSSQIGLWLLIKWLHLQNLKLNWTNSGVISRAALNKTFIWKNCIFVRWTHFIKVSLRVLRLAEKPAANFLKPAVIQKKCGSGTSCKVAVAAHATLTDGNYWAENTLTVIYDRLLIQVAQLWQRDRESSAISRKRG